MGPKFSKQLRYHRWSFSNPGTWSIEAQKYVIHNLFTNLRPKSKLSTFDSQICKNNALSFKTLPHLGPKIRLLAEYSCMCEEKLASNATADGSQPRFQCILLSKNLNLVRSLPQTIKSYVQNLQQRINLNTINFRKSSPCLWWCLLNSLLCLIFHKFARNC